MGNRKPKSYIPPNYPNILIDKFNKWKTYKLWGVDLSSVEFILRQYKRGSQSTGRAVLDETGNKIVVTAGKDPVDAIVTLIHELAHSACFHRNIDSGHGEEWRKLFLRASKRLLGALAMPVGDGWDDVHNSVVKALRGKRIKW